MKQPIILLLILLVGSLWGCVDKVQFAQTQKISHARWEADQTVAFDYKVESTTRNHDIYICLRNNNDYPYQNIYLFVEIVSPANVLLKDTIQALMSDDTGRWKGKGWGSLYSRDILYKHKIKFQNEGVYRFQIRHAMRERVLPGIANVGLMINEAQ